LRGAGGGGLVSIPYQAIASRTTVFWVNDASVDGPWLQEQHRHRDLENCTKIVILFNKNLLVQTIATEVVMVHSGFDPGITPLDDCCAPFAQDISTLQEDGSVSVTEPSVIMTGNPEGKENVCPPPLPPSKYGTTKYGRVSAALLPSREVGALSSSRSL